MSRRTLVMAIFLLWRALEMTKLLPPLMLGTMLMGNRQTPRMLLKATSLLLALNL
ncbi:hypothetical protein CCACVL1_24793 [Corchorus capsularis]|uniref:Uncharacterized protein n=1 Tax=Corchorus capsularis TaxID=210143 RepID=A0A1R3GN91_COCAP|nr:hypothetical protein CCACVL1_24793 [Corchorus capsularis]